MKIEINKDDLRKYFNYVNGELIWKERPIEDFQRDQDCKTWNKRFAGKIAGTTEYREDTQSYRSYILINSKRHRRSRLVYIYHYGDIPEGLVIDHKSGNTLDDRIQNLRAVTIQINNFNRQKSSNNKSGVTGVHWSQKKQKWIAKGKENGKVIQLYYGFSFDDAVKARKKWNDSHKFITDRHGM
ncbi:HNH endonuclease signature motif containing protein [Marinobacter salarius]|uniref:HNH endonuclease signature motif containing protein n=1 Tax=Marinobacter salarius TaxID=1420917 RepID=UPI003BAA6A9F